MAIVFLSGNKITATSGDVKPTLVATNSTLLETDTNITFQYNGSAWVQLDVGVGDTISNTELEGNISLSKLANGTAGKLVGYNSSTGVIEEQDAPSSGPQYSELTSATTFTPTIQTGHVKVTVDCTDVTSGNVDINVDGSSIKTVSSNSFESRIVNPSTSLSLVSVGVVGNISGLTYDNKSYSVSSQGGSSRDISFKSDGTKMYRMTDFGDKIGQYTLSTAWDISTASYDNISYGFSSQTSSPYGFFMKNDGTKFFITATSTVYQYTLSTAWDISTASYDNKSYNISNTSNYGIHFKSDGTKMYTLGAGPYSTPSSIVYEYNLSTAWDVSTSSSSTSFSVHAQENRATDVRFKSDGTKMYMMGRSNNRIHQYTLSTAWNLSTASYDNDYFYVGGQEGGPSGLYIKSDDSKYYVVGWSTDSIYQYSGAGGAMAGTVRISVG